MKSTYDAVLVRVGDTFAVRDGQPAIVAYIVSLIDTKTVESLSSLDQPLPYRLVVRMVLQWIVLQRADHLGARVSFDRERIGHPIKSFSIPVVGVAEQGQVGLVVLGIVIVAILNQEDLLLLHDRRRVDQASWWEDNP